MRFAGDGLQVNVRRGVMVGRIEALFLSSLPLGTRRWDPRQSRPCGGERAMAA